MTGTLIFDRLEIRLGGHSLLQLSDVVDPGDILTVMGPSGSGKSSLLACLSGFLDPAFSVSGRVLLEGRDLLALPVQARHCGLMFQDPLLFPHMSVGENIAFAIPAAVTGKKTRRTIAEQFLADAGLNGLYDRHPDTLSGGQKSRVALQRVLASRPNLLLLDEPFSKLDSKLRAETRERVFAGVRAASIPVILVTHDVADAEAAGGKVFHLDERGDRS